MSKKSNPAKPKTRTRQLTEQAESKEMHAVVNKTVAIAACHPHPRNYNAHSDAQLQDLRESLRQFGQVRSIVVQKNGKGYTVIAGHGVLEAAKREGFKTIKADIIPAAWSKSKALAYLAADNELARRASPDQAQLDALVREVLDSEGEVLARLAAGEQAALDRIIAEGRGDQEEPVSADELIDKAAELQKKWKVKRGDLWEIGKHRLMCGDSTRKEDVTQLLSERVVDQLVTDPPYGVDYSHKNKFLNEWGKGNRIQSPIENDAIEDYRKFFSAFLGTICFSTYNTIYIFMSGKELHSIRMAFDDCGLTVPASPYLVWVKNNHVLGLQDYMQKHEFIIYGWRGKHRFFGDKSTTVLEYNKPQHSDMHPTTKPLDLIVKLIGDGSRVGALVYDAFLGSGTTLVACEQTGRIGYGMEIEPKYCAVTLERLANLGLTPQRVTQ